MIFHILLSLFIIASNIVGTYVVFCWLVRQLIRLVSKIPSPKEYVRDKTQ